MKSAQKLIKVVALFCILTTFYFLFVLPALAPTRQLVGNRSTLAMCRWELSTWREYQTNGPVFNFHILTDDQKRRVIMFGLNQDFSIRTNFVWGSTPGPKIVIVSGRVYDNVPTPALWNLYWRHPAHAVGYSDGTTGLISPEQFDSLNQFGFASLWSLATNSNFRIFKQ